MQENISDHLDLASELEMKTSEASIKYISSQANKQEVLAKGYCLYCAEDFQGDKVKRFCDFDCMQDYDRSKIKSHSSRP